MKLTVLSLRYSSWSIRPWLALAHAGAEFTTETVSLPDLQRQFADNEKNALRVDLSDGRLESRRKLGSVTGLFPVLKVNDVAIHESMAIAEFVADSYPEARLWPDALIDRALARAITSSLFFS